MSILDDLARKEKEPILRKKIEEMQAAIDYELVFGYETQKEKDIYLRMNQMLDIIREIITGIEI